MANDPADEAEILELIHRNRIGVYTGDFATYESCFVHSADTTRWNASRISGIAQLQGWEEIAGRVRVLFADPQFRDPNGQRIANETRVENLRIHIHGDMAWATYAQVYTVTPIHHKGGNRTCELRILERHDGRWKIAFLGVLDDNIADRDAALVSVAADGRVLWQSPAAEVALAGDDDLVLRGGRLRLRDARADRKLQAAFAWADGLVGALVSRRASLSIVLDRGEGLSTRVLWVIADSGKVLLDLAASGLDRHRLEAAAIVFGLSPAQTTLAGHIIDGLSLPDIAARMDITPNTARTHLERIYDKTGVRTQPALVRVLLSTAAPI